MSHLDPSEGVQYNELFQTTGEVSLFQCAQVFLFWFFFKEHLQEEKWNSKEKGTGEPFFVT